MLSSKDEAKLEAYKRLRDEAKAEAEAAEVRALAAETKAEEAVFKAGEAGRELAAVRAKLDLSESTARAYSGRVQRIESEVEGVKADLMATTRRAIMGEVILKDVDARLTDLKDVLAQIAEWPVTHSAEAKAMRDLAKKALREDYVRQVLDETTRDGA